MGHAAAGVGWRLLAGNNRVVALGTVTYPDAQTNLDALTHARPRVADSPARITRVPVNRWSWQLDIDGRPFASAGHAFDRKVRCEQSLQVFRQQFREAILAETIMNVTNRRGPAPRTRS